jgi:hypothetical protein
MRVEEANALHAYIIDLSWKAYNAQQRAKSRPTIKLRLPSDRG